MLDKYTKTNTLNIGFNWEVLAYMGKRLTARETKMFTLDWLKENKAQFPLLSKLSHAVFCIPVTTAACKRVWSSGGLLITDKRSSLSPANFKYLLFIHEK